MIIKAAASMLVIAWATGAAAQSAEELPPTAKPASAAAGSASADTTVGEVIVTAQRPGQRLVDGPTSVGVPAQEDLERAGGATLENLTKLTPGVYMQKTVYGLSPTVRGIGSTLPTSGGEQNVALYVDNIYYPTASGNIFDLASVSDVEVLKGPQGTLFGRNATGGAVLLRTLDPGFSTEGRFNLSYERFNQVRTSAYLNIPLTDTLAVNASVAYRSTDGYIRDLVTDALVTEGTSFTFRGKALWQPTDSFSLILTGAHARFDDPTGDAFQNLKPALYVSLLGGPVSTDPRYTSQTTQNVIETETDEFSARAKYETSAGTFNSYTAFLGNTLDALNDLDGGYLGANVELGVRTRTFSQEVNFASASDQPFTYVVGLYYFKNRQRVPILRQNGAALFHSAGQVESWAAYADVNYEIGNLTLIGGLRYSDENRRSQFGPGTSPFVRFQKAAETAWTPRLGLQYALSERANVYATYSKGFKSGVFDATSLTGPPVSPEEVTAYEVGFKFASSEFSFNTAAYHYDYEDSQVNATVSGGGTIKTQLFNVPKARVYGVEMDASFRLSDSFDLRGAVAYTHARYLDFKSAPGYTNNPANPATLGGLLYTSIPVDASGKTMVRAPEFTASATFRYHRELGEGRTLEVALSPYYTSRVYFTFFNDLSQAGHMTLDANASLTLSNQLKLTVFGRNLTDGEYKTSAGQNALSNETAIFAPPRTYGVALSYAF